MTYNELFDLGWELFKSGEKNLGGIAEYLAMLRDDLDRGSPQTALDRAALERLPLFIATLETLRVEAAGLLLEIDPNTKGSA